MYQVSHILRDSEQPDCYWELDYRHPNVFRARYSDGTPYAGMAHWVTDEEQNLFKLYPTWPTYSLEQFNPVLENE